MAPDTSMAQALSSAGATLQGIGNAWADIRDRDDIVHAQLEFERGLVDLDKLYADDNGFGDIRDRRAQDVKDLSARALEGISEAAKRSLAPEIAKAQLADGVRFDSFAMKREGAHRLNRFEENKSFLMNSYIYAADESELQDAENKIMISVEAVKPFLPADKVAAFSNQIVNEAKYLRASNGIEAQVRSGEAFDPSKYATLQPEQVVRLQSQWNQTEKNIQAEAKAYYNERIQDHRTVMINLGKDSGLADELIGMGNTELAAKVMAQDKIDRVVYGALVGASASNRSGSLIEKYDRALSSLTYGPQDTMAAEKQQAIDTIKAARASAIKEFTADPVKVVLENGVTRKSGESMAEFSARVMDKQRELAGDVRFPVEVLSKDQQTAYKGEIQAAIDSNDSNRVLDMLAQLEDFKQFQHQALSELKLNSGVHVAMDSDPATASRVVKLLNVKTPKDLDADYKEDLNITKITRNAYISMLTDRVMRDPSPQMVAYRNDMVDLAHKWMASGRDIDDLFKAYNVAETNRGRVVIGAGVDDDAFDDAVELVLSGTDYSAYVPDGNPNKDAVLARLKEEAQIVNAPTSDTRVPYGQRGFYIINPMTGGALVDYRTGMPAIISEDQILAASRMDKKSFFGKIIGGE